MENAQWQQWLSAKALSQRHQGSSPNSFTYLNYYYLRILFNVSEPQFPHL